MTYAAQELNTRVQIQKVTRIRDPLGGDREVWSTFAETFAKVEPLVGREFIAAQAEHSELTAKVTMRWRADVSQLHRLMIRGDSYGIISAQNIRYKNRELLLYVKRIS